MMWSLRVLWCSTFSWYFSLLLYQTGKPRCYAIFTTTVIIITTLFLIHYNSFSTYSYDALWCVGRVCYMNPPLNGLSWDRAVFSSVIELRVTQSKGLGFFKSQETNEMNYLSRPLKSMKDWIYEYLPSPKFTDAAKQLSVSSEK